MGANRTGTNLLKSSIYNEKRKKDASVGAEDAIRQIRPTYKAKETYLSLAVV
jgi:hypothetical protein